MGACAYSGEGKEMEERSEGVQSGLAGLTGKSNLFCISCLALAESEHALCPSNWHQHGGNCYLFSNITDITTWSKSHEHCSSLDSRLLVIRDQEQLDWISSVSTIKDYAWIGLFNTTPGRRWTWVNGTALNQKMLRVQDCDEDSCGVMKKKWIDCESCSAQLNWVCQKETQWCTKPPVDNAQRQ
ncbi:killer cell lectin-like receptor subfamily F member 1 [Pleurodeles waltl]|uniref:killer cell lectin-like receptor subfamily F member 1 n=1 Tax=Pleurodeles waltl TaxID=8319 RepID=UPI003709C2E3